MLETAYDFLKD